MSLLTLSLALAAEVEALPPTGAWRHPVADTRAPLSQVVMRGELTDDVDAEFGEMIDATIGGELRAVEVRIDELTLQAGLVGGAYMGFRQGGELTFALRTFDGIFGLPLDAHWRFLSARLAWAHASAHTADGSRDTEGPSPTVDRWSRETLTLLAGPTWRACRAYGGAELVYHDVEVYPQWGLQVGGEAALPWPLSPYVAVDLKLHQDSAWEPGLAFQVGGWYASHQRVRTALIGYFGPDDTGKYQGRDERYLGFVLGLDGTGALGGFSAPGP